MNSAQKFIESEFNLVENKNNPHCKDWFRSNYKPRIQISCNDGTRTHHISISWDTLEQIRQLLLDNETT